MEKKVSLFDKFLVLFGTDSMETKSFLESGIQKVFTEAEKWQKHIFSGNHCSLKGEIKLKRG